MAEGLDCGNGRVLVGPEDFKSFCRVLKPSGVGSIPTRSRHYCSGRYEFFPLHRSTQSFRPEIVEAVIEHRIVDLYLHRILDNHPRSGIRNGLVIQ
jgi:hypothetical protein